MALLAVHGTGQVWLIDAVMFAYGVSGQVVGPAQSALLTVMVPAALLPDANAALRTVQAYGRYLSRTGSKDAALKVYHDFQLTILEEDRSMIESMQRAMASGAYEPGRLAVLEKPIHHHLKGYIERMF